MKLTLTILVTGLLAAALPAAVTMDWVNVGDAGNTADNNGIGAVAYDYKIGKYEVTNAQYTAFLNAADPTGANANEIYNALMGSEARGGITYTAGAGSGSKYTVRTNMGNKPVNYVDWYDAARFTNWLGNGQGSGSTETGAYTLNNNIGLITKNVGATVWIPSENEWYKAAYYDSTKGGTGGYWAYATQSDTAPTVGSANPSGDISNSGLNVVNYNNGAIWNGQTGNVTTVGSAGSLSESYYGTADMNGNVWEWNDAVSDADRQIRGSSFGSSNITASVSLSPLGPSQDANNVGFRVASVPEPSAYLLTVLSASVLLTRRRRSTLFL